MDRATAQTPPGQPPNVLGRINKIGNGYEGILTDIYLRAYSKPIAIEKNSPK